MVLVEEPGEKLARAQPCELELAQMYTSGRVCRLGTALT